MSTTAACPVCLSVDTGTFYTQPDVPCQDGVIWATREEAQAAPRGDIELVHCRACGHVFNCRFDPTKLVVDPSRHGAEPPAAGAVGPVILRSVLQYQPDPRALLNGVRSTLTGPDATVQAQTPNSGYVFEKLSIWNIVYEQGCFFGRTSLTKLFTECGFAVQTCVTTGTEDQSITIEASLAEGPTTFAFDPAEVERFSRVIDRFANDHQHKVTYWRNTLDRLRTQGKRLAMWGAGARAQSFCNLFEMGDGVLPYIVDSNPARQGRYMPKTLQVVVPPEQLQVEPPDVILITHSGYAPEIRRQIDGLGLRCEVLVLD